MRFLLCHTASNLSLIFLNIFFTSVQKYRDFSVIGLIIQDKFLLILFPINCHWVVKLLIAYGAPIISTEGYSDDMQQILVKSKIIRENLTLQFSQLVDGNQDKDLGELFYKIICASISQVEISDDQLTTNSLNRVYIR